jgi:hypothetical protein
LLIVALVVAGVTFRRSRSAAKVIQHSLYWSIPALSSLLPWLIRSYALTGNPLFPFANSIFQSVLAPPKLPIAHMGVGLTLPEIITVPWGIFFDPPQYVELGTYHPLILASALLGATGLLWAPRRQWFWLGAGGLAFVAWLVTEQNTRYSLHAVYLLWLALSLGLAQWHNRIRSLGWRRLFEFGLLAGLIWGFAMQTLRPTFWMQTGISGVALPIQVVLGRQTESAYLATHVPTFLCADWFNARYGDRAKIWQVPPLRDHLYFEAQAFAWPHGVQPAMQPLLDILIVPSLRDDFAAIHQRLISGGITHLAIDMVDNRWVNENEADRQGVLSQTFERTYLRLECADRGLALYRISPTALPLNRLPAVGPDLLLNAGFEALDPNGLPADWNLSGPALAAHSNGNVVLRLTEGARLTQSIAVSEHTLYELTAKYRSYAAPQTTIAQITWLDAAGQLLLFWRGALQPTTEFAHYRFLQTAPAGAQRVTVSVFGSSIELDNIRLHELRP